MKNTDKAFDAPTLERGVDVGAGAVILGAIVVGEGAHVGANAVVVKDVEAGAVAVGVPAKVIGRKPATPTPTTSSTTTPKAPPVKDA
jgi:serine O-acetyltransferase